MSAGTKSFKTGRDLAVAMLRAVKDKGVDASSIEAHYRDGRPQDNWALPYIRRLAEHPELAGGFSAVFSDYLGQAGMTNPNVYASLTVKQMLGTTAPA